MPHIERRWHKSPLIGTSATSFQFCQNKFTQLPVQRRILLQSKIPFQYRKDKMRLVIILFLNIAAFVCAQNKNEEPDGFFRKESDCSVKCIGHRDSGCLRNSTANDIHYCSCQMGYFSNAGQCDNECSDNQFWSLFTYGKCTNVPLSRNFENLVGSCKWMCAFRVRVWTTVFIIILFFSACVLLLLMLPACIMDCYNCCFLRKEKKRAKQEGGYSDPMGTIVKPGTSSTLQRQQVASSGYQYPSYGWPQYYGQQGRM